MKRISRYLTVFALFAVPSLAATTLEFGPGTVEWSYDGAGMLSFQQTYLLTKGLLSPFDALVGEYMHIHIPDFTVGCIPVQPYILTPAISTIGSATFTTMAGMSFPPLDFELSCHGFDTCFKNMLDHWWTCHDGLSCEKTIVPVPAPGAILLAGIGTALVGWLRRRRTV